MPVVGLAVAIQPPGLTVAGLYIPAAVTAPAPVWYLVVDVWL